MNKNITIVLSEHYESFVNEKIASGKYATVSEIENKAFHFLESEEKKAKALILELEIGEKSGLVNNFNRTENLKQFHYKHLN